MKVEVGKSYLYIQKSHAQWDVFISSVVEDLSISQSDIISFHPEGGVEDLRKSISNLAIRPHSSPCRLMVIYDGDSLNSEQANTLLKTLEEPPSYLSVIVCCQGLSKILPTIKSRCIRIYGEVEKTDAGKPELLNYLESDFNTFLSSIKNIESREIPDMLNLSLEYIKRRGLSTENLELYKKMADAFIRVSSTNANARLALEDIYIWYKAGQEK